MSARSHLKLDGWSAATLEALVMRLDPTARRQGRGWILRCFAHDDQKPSLSMVVAENGKLLMKCHAGCSQDALIAGFPDVLTPREDTVIPLDEGRRPRDQVLKEPDRRRSAKQLFQRSRSIEGTPAERYLCEFRRIPAETVALLRDQVRYCSNLKAPKDVSSADTFCGLLARLARSVGVFAAVQRHYLKKSGAKADFDRPKRFLGSPLGAGCYVGLSPVDPIKGSAIIAEGLETLLSVMALRGFRQGIAAFSADNLARLELPPPNPDDPGRIAIAYDAGRVGKDAAKALAERLTHAGYVSELVEPPEGLHAETGKALDWNDVLCGAPVLVSDATEKPADPPKGYRRGPDGSVEYLEPVGEDDAGWRRLCSPLDVLAFTSDDRSSNWGYRVRVFDPDGNAHILTLAAEKLFDDGREALRELARHGLRPESVRNQRSKIVDYIARSHSTQRKRVARRFGWIGAHCQSYMLRNGSALGDPDLVLGDDLLRTVQSAKSTVSGSLDGWRSEVAGLAVGDPILAFAISVGFAGALLEPLGLDGGGFHLRGASSRGKTTALRLAGSVWDSDQILSTWRATSNGLEAAAVTSNGSILILDEMAEIDAREAGSVAYMLANGRGKERMDANTARRLQASWRTLVLSSGEISLADKLAEAGRRPKAGEAVRMLDIPATDQRFGAFDQLHGAQTPSRFADRLRQASDDHFGWAGPAFVRWLIEDIDGARSDAQQRVGLFQDRALRHLSRGGSTDPQVSRALHRIALVAAAGDIATDIGLTGWPRGEAEQAALAVSRLWYANRGGGRSLEESETLARVRGFIARHGAGRFELLGQTDADGKRNPAVRNRAGWHDPVAGVFYIQSDVWREEVLAGLDPRNAARILADLELLVQCERGSFQARLPREVPDRPRAYAVRAEILGCSDDGEPRSENADQLDHLDRAA